jgi:hypothetical protein
LAPSVRTLFTDGRRVDSLRESWAAADIFVSLADNIQETFGLTPIEAMAAGLPVVVSDWDGYKHTIRDGIDGFRIPTWMPAAGLGQHLAARHEFGMDNYDRYCGLSAQDVSVDGSVLRAVLTRLVNDASLRASLGMAGQERARKQYDWSVVFGLYQQLITELTSRRNMPHAEQVDQRLAAVKSSPRRIDPYLAFASYATRHVGADTRVSTPPGTTFTAFNNLRSTPLWKHTADGLPNEAVVAAVLSTTDGSVADIAAQTGLAVDQVIAAVAPLAKMGLVYLTNANAS